jgi:hypothetical protein
VEGVNVGAVPAIYLDTLFDERFFGAAETREPTVEGITTDARFIKGEQTRVAGSSGDA